ncbi:hypothetical protein E3N88_10045 [Mikania micrantha]|uniref:Uncharacterized protein n=1 Tax=Mikania micrantha TaxID=192012 RepID=A0A5N6PBB9_9ASTR|nr:hypothetical protein E3N88_10045 [Mikania micrantha]
MNDYVEFTELIPSLPGPLSSTNAGTGLGYGDCNLWYQSSIGIRASFCRFEGRELESRRQQPFGCCCCWQTPEKRGEGCDSPIQATVRTEKRFGESKKKNKGPLMLCETVHEKQPVWLLKTWVVRVGEEDNLCGSNQTCVGVMAVWEKKRAVWEKVNLCGLTLKKVMASSSYGRRDVQEVVAEKELCVLERATSRITRLGG